MKHLKISGTLLICFYPCYDASYIYIYIKRYGNFYVDDNKTDNSIPCPQTWGNSSICTQAESICRPGQMLPSGCDQLGIFEADIYKLWLSFIHFVKLCFGVSRSRCIVCLHTHKHENIDKLRNSTVSRCTEGITILNCSLFCKC